MLAESIRLRAEAMRQRLQLPDPSLVESLAIENLVLCWTEHNYLQLQFGDENRPHLQVKTRSLVNAAYQRYSIALRLYEFIKHNRDAAARAPQSVSWEAGDQALVCGRPGSG